MVKKLEIFLFLLFFYTFAFAAIVPKATNVPNFPKTDEVLMNDENAQSTKVQDNVTVDSKSSTESPSVQNAPQQPQADAPTLQNTTSQNTINNDERIKLLDLIIGLKLVQRINEINQLDEAVRTSALVNALGIVEPVTSEIPANVFGQVTPIGNAGTVVPASTLAIALGNLFRLAALVLTNTNTPIKELSNAVGPAGVPIASAPTILPIGSIGTAGTIGTTGTGTISINKPSFIITPSGILANLGLATPLQTTGVTNLPVLTQLLGTLQAIHGRSFGSKPETENMQWMASVIVDGKMISKGVLVSGQHILTLASPLLNIDYKNIQIKLGENDFCDDNPNLLTVSSILANPKFNPQTKSHDMALLKLSEKVTGNGKSISICLPPLASDYTMREVTVPTWQSPSHEQLCKPRSIQLPLKKEENCYKSLDPSALLTTDKRCMSSKSDMENLCKMVVVGSPVQVRGVDGTVRLHGLVSNPEVCEEEHTMYYIRVMDHLPWLLEHVKDDNVCMGI